MAGIHEPCVHARRDLPGLPVVDGPEMRDRPFRVLDRVQRLVEIDVELGRLGPQVRLRVERPWSVRSVPVRPGRLDARRDVLAAVARRRCREVQGGLIRVGLLSVVGGDLVGIAPLPAGLPLGEFLVQMTGIEQHERGQLDGAGGGVDRTLVAGLHEEREQPAVVQVRVGQDDGVQLARLERERDPVPNAFIGAALEHPAVDEDSGALGRDQELGSRDGRRATEELDLHDRMVTLGTPRRACRDPFDTLRGCCSVGPSARSFRVSPD